MTAAGIPALLEPIQERLDAQLPDSARMDAYYYGFNRTGFGPVDAILSAVAVAGKGSHHTESWGGNESAWFYGDRPGLPSADGAEDLIQKTADLAARNITTDTARLLAAVKAVAALHKPYAICDPCECTDHPEEYEYIDCGEYNGCEQTITGWACGECCSDAMWFNTEECATNHRHTMNKDERCPTVSAVESALRGEA